MRAAVPSFTILFALACRAAAQDPEPIADAELDPKWGTSKEEAELLEWQNADPRSEGMGVFSLSGELALLDRQRATGQRRELGGGFNLAALAARKTAWPFLFGLNLGITFLDYRSTRGPDVGVWARASTLERTLELRHLDLLVRVQPWWGPVRPYLEGSFGVAGLWATSNWSASDGETLAGEDVLRSVSYLTGLSAGVDVPLFTLSEGTLNVFQLVLSVGVRRLYTGPLKWTSVVLSEGDDVPRMATVRERLRIWQPFASFTFSVHSKPRPANAQWVGGEP